MNREDVRTFVFKMKGTIEDYPFGDDTAVFKVGEKMFLLMNLSKKEDFPITLKATPENVDFYTDNYENITRGYYTNKRHWVTITIDESTDSKFIEKLISDSYELVFDKLTKKKQKEITETN